MASTDSKASSFSPSVAISRKWSRHEHPQTPSQPVQTAERVIRAFNRTRHEFRPLTLDQVGTAVETFFFWPAPETDLLEVRRVLQPVGQLLIACAMYKGGKHDKRNQKFVDEINMTYLGEDEFQRLLGDSGFDNIDVVVEYEKGWICATARTAV